LRNPGPPVSGPGSKKPEPASIAVVPVITTLDDATFCGTELGAAEEAVAGGGAISLTARTP